MRVLGIDPGLAHCGWGVVEDHDSAGGGEGYHLVEAGVIATPADLPVPQRLKAIYEGVRELIARFQPDALAVEELYFARNSKTAMAVAQARGVILLAGAELPTSSYTPLEVKLQITGFGRAGKWQVQGMVARLLGLDQLPKPDHAADALAIALCHLLRRRSYVHAQAPVPAERGG